MVKIRLRRMGANKKPFFRIVATDIRSANAGNFIEELGWYEPGKKTDNYKLDLAKAEAWISLEVQITTVSWSPPPPMAVAR